jgi:hypothetical protein
MSRYLQALVMRSLGDRSGLSPRPVTRYESARQSGTAEPEGSMQEQAGMDVSLGYERPVQGPLSRPSPIGTDVRPLEEAIQRGRQNDVSVSNEAGRQSIEQRRRNQSGNSGERQTGAVHRQVEAAQVPDDSGRSRSIGRTVRVEGVVGSVDPVLRRDVTSLDGREAPATSMTQRSEFLPGISDSTDQPTTVKNHPSARRPPEVLSNSLRPTMREVSGRQVRGEATGQPIGARPPVVRIHIGRIEVRAVSPPAPASSKRLVEQPRSSMPLDQYLRRRS